MGTSTQVEDPMALQNWKVRRLFKDNQTVKFFARNCNILKWRAVGLGKTQSFSFIAFLKAIHITPEQLRPLLSIRQSQELPEKLNGYEDLPEDTSFGNSEEEYKELARLLGKKVAVHREYGDSPFSPLLFTVHPDGRVEPVPKS